MNSIICGIIGLAAGLTGGYFFFRSQSKELEERIERLEAENNKLVQEAHETAEKAITSRSKAIQKAEKKLAKNDIPKPEKEERIDYEKLSKEYHSDEFDRHFETRVAPPEDEPDDDIADKEDDIPAIRIITEDVFMNMLPERPNEVLRYYQDDGVLTDALGQTVGNKEAAIGLEGIQECMETDDDCVYIDNTVDDILYEVVIDHSTSYYRDVMGVY